jgi:hypothetical protein
VLFSVTYSYLVREVKQFLPDKFVSCSKYEVLKGGYYLSDQV